MTVRGEKGRCRWLSGALPGKLAAAPQHSCNCCMDRCTYRVCLGDGELACTEDGWCVCMQRGSAHQLRRPACMRACACLHCRAAADGWCVGCRPGCAVLDMSGSVLQLHSVPYCGGDWRTARLSWATLVRLWVPGLRGRPFLHAGRLRHELVGRWLVTAIGTQQRHRPESWLRGTAVFTYHQALGDVACCVNNLWGLMRITLSSSDLIVQAKAAVHHTDQKHIRGVGHQNSTPCLGEYMNGQLHSSPCRCSS